jgi:alpha-L-rhamnosidase
MRRLIIATTLVASFPAGGFTAEPGDVRIENLRCEYLVNPLGIDHTEPRLSWTLQSDTRGQKQTAYQVLVADHQDKLSVDEGNVWDSGKVASEASLHIRVSGKSLDSRRRCYWKVRIWDRDGKVSDWSEPATWTMGLLDEKAWHHAQWIGARAPETHTDQPLPVQMLRKEFLLDKPAGHATVTVSALGLYELYINGERVGNHQLAPEWTDYQRHIQYQTFDVTKLLKPGRNAITASLGDGWYSGRIGLSHIVKDGPLRAIYGPRPRLLLLLEVAANDGTQTYVSTDGTWRLTEDGPIRVADILDGEIYDARQEVDGWQLPGFDDSKWTPVTVADKTSGKLVAQMNEPVRVVEELVPVEITEPMPGVYIFDLGQNMVGWCRIKVRGKPGQEIRLRHVEVLNEDGTIYRDNLRMPADGGPLGARQEDTYICRGEGEELFEPHFTFHGFRYVEVTGLQEKPETDFLIGRVLCSSFPETGTFECSDAMLNQLDRNILWGLRGNMLGVPTDCPQRDERLGWMGDAQVFAPAACWNTDMAAFFTKWMRDVRDAQADDGRFPDFAPHPFDPNARFSGVAAWGDAGVIVPWVVFQRYGDLQILRENYESSKRWIEWIRRNNPDFLWRKARGNDYGDWLNGDSLIQEGYPKTGAEIPKDLFATLIFGHSTRLVSQMAEVLGKEQEAKEYGRLANAIRQAFQKTFVDQNARIVGDTQSGYALALAFDMLPKNQRAQAVAHMVEAVEKYDRHISTGFVSTIQLMHALTAAGYQKVAYQLLNNKTFPSWGYSIEQGATTIWERWDGYVKGRGFQDPGMNSFNHYTFGSVSDWMWKNIVGIDTVGPAFKRIVIHPRVGGGLEWAKGTYESVRGPIGVDWKKTGERLSIDISIPPNSTATVYVPVTEKTVVKESGNPIGDVAGVKTLRHEDGCVVFAVGSGTYRFQVN